MAILFGVLIGLILGIAGTWLMAESLLQRQKMFTDYWQAEAKKWADAANEAQGRFISRKDIL